MACTGCTDRRRDIVAAGKAFRAGQRDLAAQHIRVASKSFSDDARAFVAALKARLAQR